MEIGVSRRKTGVLAMVGFKPGACLEPLPKIFLKMVQNFFGRCR